MKKIIFGLILLCCTSTTHAQMKPLEDQRYATGDVLAQLEGLVEKFCEYVEFIGTTPANESEKASLSAKKKKMRENEIPKLFHHYSQRKMITTSHAGVPLPPKPMRTYFRNLQTQADNNRMDTRISYDLEFTFATNNGKVKWEKGDRLSDGTQEYVATVWIFQTYLKETVKGMEVLRQKREIDRKEMIIKKLVLPNGNTVIGLDDIKSAEQLK